MDLSSWLAQRSGIAHSAQALRAGFSRYAIRQSLADGLTHISVARNASVPAATGLRVHWGGAPVTAARFALVDPVENALVHIADCQPYENALVVWDSALNKKLVTEHSLGRLHLHSAAARSVRAVASGLADSGLETLPVSRLAVSGIRVHQQVTIDGHRVDGLIGHRLVLQIEGFSFHSSAEQRRADIAQDRRLALLGYTVLRYDYRQILFEWPQIENEILRAMAQGLHLSPAHDRR